MRTHVPHACMLNNHSLHMLCMNTQVKTVHFDWDLYAHRLASGET